MKFSTTDLVTFTEEILNGKLHILYSVWSLLTDKSAKTHDDESDSNYEINGNTYVHEKLERSHCSLHPIVLYNVDGPTISSTEVVNIAPCENEIPVSFYLESAWEVLTFPGQYPSANNYLIEPRKRNTSPIKHVHARLKCSND